MTTSKEDIEARLLKFATGFDGRLPSQDITNATDLISRREWGIGLEVLCIQLTEHDIQLTADEIRELKKVAAIMSLDLPSFRLVD